MDSEYSDLFLHIYALGSREIRPCECFKKSSGARGEVAGNDNRCASRWDACVRGQYLIAVLRGVDFTTNSLRRQ